MKYLVCIARKTVNSYLIVASGGDSLVVGRRLLTAVASLTVEHGPWGMQASVAAALGSVALGPGLSCSVACGIFPDQGSNLSLLHWQVDSSPRPTRKASYKLSFKCL